MLEVDFKPNNPTKSACNVRLHPLIYYKLALFSSRCETSNNYDVLKLYINVYYLSFVITHFTSL